jgi:hypothetical protein
MSSVTATPGPSISTLPSFAETFRFQAQGTHHVDSPIGDLRLRIVPGIDPRQDETWRT